MRPTPHDGESLVRRVTRPDGARFLVFHSTVIGSPPGFEPEKWYVVPYPVPLDMPAGDPFESAEDAIRELGRSEVPLPAGVPRLARLDATESQDYRVVYWSAFRFLSAERSLCRAFGYDEPTDVERIRAMIANDLRKPSEAIDSGLTERAIRDAIRDFLAK